MRWERERERERERKRKRRKWRHHSSAKTGDEFALSLVKILHFSSSLPKWRWVHTFRCQKIRTLCKNRTLRSASLKWPEKWSKNGTSHRMFGCTILLPTKKWIKLIPKTIGNRKRDCAWGCARGINTTWENLQIAKHKSGRRSFRSPDWFVLCDLQIFSGDVYPPSATSRTISFSISHSFWYLSIYDRLGLPIYRYSAPITSTNKSDVTKTIFWPFSRCHCRLRACWKSDRLDEGSSGSF